MKILIINSGSSSLKYQVINYEGSEVLCVGLCERIGIKDPQMTHTLISGEKIRAGKDFKNHKDAVLAMVEMLTSKEYGVISDLSEIQAIGHRVLHGGEEFTAPVQITEAVKAAIRTCCVWGPLHNPANLTGIEVCEEIMPGIPQVAVFDTAFHQTMPPEAYIYALPYRYYEDMGIRRYGFHGTSHMFVSQQAVQLLGGKAEGTKIITAHLGNGSSFAAVKDGKCVDTSMGLTPLAGIPMGTRCGDIDPAIVPYIMEKEDLKPNEIDHIMNKESGVLGVSGVSSDFRDLATKAKAGNERAGLALDIFVYQGKKIISSYAGALGGADAIVFTAGIGENDYVTRARMLAGLEFMGVKIDDEKNSNFNGQAGLISSDDSKVKVFVIPTNEELSIALQTVDVLGLAN
ncbi:MAG TPA: acetate kinase [Clostridiaceae bacterium]|nr:acetate kinase [Clostridiaceae bacterium]